MSYTLHPLKRQELAQELAHEQPIGFTVYIDGKPWKDFDVRAVASKVVRTLTAKGKRAQVIERWV
jgi:hypothetical protein